MVASMCCIQSPLAKMFLTTTLFLPHCTWYEGCVVLHVWCVLYMDMRAVQCMCVLCLCVLYDLCTVLYALVIVLLVCAVFGHVLYNMCTTR